eukprot:6127722-Alexandrium_andersonii.AAC.1
MGRLGSRKAEWQAWRDFQAVEVLDQADSDRVRSQNRDLVIPMRWVDTNKNDGKFDASGSPLPMLPKS